MFIFASSQDMTPRLNDQTFLVSRSLRSTPTPASRSFTATTNRSASERRDRYSVPSAFCLGTLPLATAGAYEPGRHFRRSPSHVPCKSRRPGSRRLYAEHHLAKNTGTRQAHLEGKNVKSLNFDAI